MGPAPPTDRQPDPVQRVALTRLRRFERIAAVAEGSGSPLWRRLARRAAAAALRDCLLVGLPATAAAPAAAGGVTRARARRAGLHPMRCRAVGR
jgi:hypothetical protein